MTPKTQSEASDAYDRAAHRLKVLIAQADTVQESLTAALAEDDEDEVIRLEDLLDDVRREIEAAGNDSIAAGERLDGFTP